MVNIFNEIYKENLLKLFSNYHHKNDILKQIEVIVDEIVNKIHPDKIYLFGSYVKGFATKNSDLDLLIIVDDSRDIKKVKNEIFDILYDLYGQKLNYEIEIDSHIISRETFIRDRDNSRTFCGSVLRHSVKLYEI